MLLYFCFVDIYTILVKLWTFVCVCYVTYPFIISCCMNGCGLIGCRLYSRATYVCVAELSLSTPLISPKTGSCPYWSVASKTKCAPTFKTCWSDTTCLAGSCDPRLVAPPVLALQRCVRSSGFCTAVVECEPCKLLDSLCFWALSNWNSFQFDKTLTFHNSITFSVAVVLETD